MKLIVTGRHVVVPPAVRRQIETHVARLDRILGDNAVSVQCIVSRDRLEFACELILHVRGDHVLRAVGRHARIDSAVAAARVRISQQAERLLDRWKTRRRDGRTNGRVAAEEPRTPAEAEAPAAPRVIRARGDFVKPMTVDDAVLTLTGKDQPFVVFRHSLSGIVSVLYRRPDGHFGLIEPEA
jgi:putative sigma-54 modulation protein